MPQYALDNDLTDMVEGEVFEQDVERRKQEDSLRKFRMKESNLLISNSLLEVGVDSVRCNLVVAMDPPANFNSYAHYKVKAKAQKSHFVVFGEEREIAPLRKTMKWYRETEEKLKSSCTFPGIQTTSLPPSSRGNDDANTRALANAYYYLNRYCAKLPSDTLYVICSNLF